MNRMADGSEKRVGRQLLRQFNTSSLDTDNTAWLALSLRVCVLSGLQSTSDSKSRCSNSGVDDDVNMVAAAAASSDEDLYRVLVLGGPGVGKTAITQQFLTSEYMAAQNTSFGQLRELH